MIDPPAAFRPRARASTLEAYRSMYERSVRDPEAFWLEEASRLDWDRAPERALIERGDGEFSWFEGARLNAAVNCVDRHARRTPEKPALIWAKNEPGAYETITFAELEVLVGRTANLLRAEGVERGDPVCLYLPMTPELPIAMLACARIGAPHSVVFAGFSAQALRDRIVDAGARLVITANEGVRGSKTIALKAIVDEAIEDLSIVESVLVSRRTEAEVSMRAGRDLWLEEERAKQRACCPAASMDAEDPLFLLYTSGSTGRPKGLVHTTGGYLTWTSYTFGEVFDIGPDDVHFCAADIGWITGHSYIVYGPLARGTTTVLFESTPLYPAPDRYWQIVDDLGATTFYTSPTALRALMREGSAPLSGSSRASLRVLGSVGEPINPQVWRWYYEEVGARRCPIVDTWWQTETGGVMIAPLPGATPAKPGSATLPMCGVRPVVVDDQGRELTGGGVEGKLCIVGPWPGQARTIYGDHERYLKTYFAPFPGFYFSGDGCKRDEDGYYWITGRVDDVINVSGHRLGTAEIESALVAHEAVAEAAVVPIPHEIKGQGIAAWVVPKADEMGDRGALRAALIEQVRRAIGPIAAPEAIFVVDALPKTRSGKIMRRVLRKIASKETDGLGDLSTLADPEVVDALIEEAASAGSA